MPASNRQLSHCCREAEEQKAKLAAELRAKQEAEEAERMRMRKEKEAARQRLKRLEQTFALRLESTIKVSRPEKASRSSISSPIDVNCIC